MNNLVNKGGKLYKSKIDGSEETPYEVATFYPYNINVVGDWIYYLTLGSSLKEVTDINKGIVKVKTDGTELSQVVADDMITNLAAVGDWIYFDNRGAVFRMKLNGTGLESLK